MTADPAQSIPQTAPTSTQPGGTSFSTTNRRTEPPPHRAASFSKPHRTLSDVDLLAEVAMTLAHKHGKVTADDLRILTPNAPNKTANYGACFRKLVTEGRLVFIQYQRSQRGSNHGRKISVYAPPVKGVRTCP